MKNDMRPAQQPDYGKTLLPLGSSLEDSYEKLETLLKASGGKKMVPQEELMSISWPFIFDVDDENEINEKRSCQNTHCVGGHCVTTKGDCEGGYCAVELKIKTQAQTASYQREFQYENSPETCEPENANRCIGCYECRDRYGEKCIDLYACQHSYGHCINLHQCEGGFYGTHNQPESNLCPPPCYPYKSNCMSFFCPTVKHCQQVKHYSIHNCIPLKHYSLTHCMPHKHYSLQNCYPKKHYSLPYCQIQKGPNCYSWFNPCKICLTPNCCISIVPHPNQCKTAIDTSTLEHQNILTDVSRIMGIGRKIASRLLADKYDISSAQKELGKEMGDCAKTTLGNKVTEENAHFLAYNTLMALMQGEIIEGVFDEKKSKISVNAGKILLLATDEDKSWKDMASMIVFPWLSGYLSAFGLLVKTEFDKEPSAEKSILTIELATTKK